MKYNVIKTKFCEIILVGDENGLTNLHLDTRQGKRGEFNISKDWIIDEEIFKDIENQIFEYFDGKRKRFDIKLNLKGTDFQKSVWKELQKIPYGELYSYRDIAEKLGNPKVCRAVGTANGKNPIPLIIPCHRVIGSNGNLAGFAHGLDIKQDLINLEKENKKTLVI